jgi:hypothetical protein
VETIFSETTVSETGETTKPGRRCWTREWAESRRGSLAIAIVALVMIFLVGKLLDMKFYHAIPSHSQAAVTKPATTNTLPDARALLAQEKTREAAAQLNRELIHGRDGFENPVERQLENDPQVFSKVPGFAFKGDMSSARDRKAWAQHNAHVIAIKTGHVDPKFGGEIRYRKADAVRIVIAVAPDGKGIVVNEYPTNDGTKAHRIQNTSQHNNFLGYGSLQFYERFWPDVQK